MSENLAELQVQLQLQTASFEKGVKNMDRQLKRMEKNTNRTNKSMAKLQKQVKSLGKGFIAAAAAADNERWEVDQRLISMYSPGIQQRQE